MTEFTSKNTTVLPERLSYNVFENNLIIVEDCDKFLTYLQEIIIFNYAIRVILYASLSGITGNFINVYAR